MKRYVVGFAFGDGSSRVVLVRKNRPAWQAGKLNGVGGKIADGETPHAAMIREFKEEAGLTVIGWECFARISGLEPAGAEFPKGQQFEVYFFRANIIHETLANVRSTTDERIEVFDTSDLSWLDDTVYEFPLIPNLRWLLPMASERHRHDWPYNIYERAHIVKETSQ